MAPIAALNWSRSDVTICESARTEGEGEREKERAGHGKLWMGKKTLRKMKPIGFCEPHLTRTHVYYL